MRCTICGYESESTTVCPYCGSPLSQHAAAQEETTLPLDAAQVASAASKPCKTAKPFGAGKIVLTVFLSILAGLLIVLSTCTLLIRWDPFHIHEQFGPWIQEPDEDPFNNPFWDWQGEHGEWY